MSAVISIPKITGYDMSDLRQSIDSQAEQDEVISNNGFFPDISLLAIRHAMRIDGTVTNQRLKNASIEAIATVNQDLAEFKHKNLAQNHRTLGEIGSEIINGESILTQRYLRAVYCMAVANLNERYRSYDTTKDGEDNAEKLEESVADLRRDARFAIRDILGQSRITVELI